MKSWYNRAVAAGAVLLISAAAFSIGTGVTLPQTQVSAQQTAILADEAAITGIYESASPAVVELAVNSRSTGFGGSYNQRGQGSGFVVDREGYIVTNNHVVSGSTSIRVTFANGDTADATLVGTDSADDLAVIKVDASAVSDITPLELANSSDLKPGQTAIALGSPYGLSNTISVGVISGLDRTIGSGQLGMIQTDANIQPGNSGGPLLNSMGEVVGVNTAIEGQGTGIGYAVPSNIVARVLPDLKAGRQIARPWIGISGLDLDAETAETLDLPVSQGVYIITVSSGSPAEEAGLRPGGTMQGVPGQGGDVILSIDGESVAGVREIQNVLAEKKVGDTVNLSVLRDGATITVTVTLGARPNA